jgi:hypothetical protein
MSHLCQIQYCIHTLCIADTLTFLIILAFRIYLNFDGNNVLDLFIICVELCHTNSKPILFLGVS